MTDNTLSTPFGAITNVEGITVGHHQRASRGWQTGTTVVGAPTGATPGVDVRGGGPGTRETDALHPQNLIERIHAVCLTGGSAYGLAAADGVMAWMEAHGKGFPVGPPEQTPVHVVPVVPTAVIFDLGRGGNFGHRPDASFGWRASAAARTLQRNWGAVGAGTGARAGGLQGGVGTASSVVRVGSADHGYSSVVVGALAVVNANGSVIDPETGLPWEHRGRSAWTPSTRQLRTLRAALGTGGQNPANGVALNTTIGVVATSAKLTKSEVSKMAGVAHDGLARAVRPAHSMFDGDTIFGLATGQTALPSEPSRLGLVDSHHGALNQVLRAAADTFAAACLHAVLAAVTIGSLPAYRDLVPGANFDVVN